MAIKCVLHVTWAINRRAREIEEREHRNVTSIDDPELIEAARQAPDAEVVAAGGKTVCMQCFVEGRA